MVDTHAHIYHPDEARYPMIEDPSRPPQGTGTIEHLRENAAEAGVEKVVLVQTGSAYRWDNRLLADTVKANADWMVGVCTLDPSDPTSPAELERLYEGYHVRGVRVEPTRADPVRFAHPRSAALWETAGDLGAVVCAHVQSRFLGELAELLEQFPSVPVVLDHAAYPKAAEGASSGTVTSVVDLARFRQLHVKLTFTVTGSDEAYPFTDTHAIVRAILDAYGPDRCVWGSDFPCEHWLKKATYRQHLELFRSELSLTEAERAAILSDTAERLWFA